ncbi:MAG: hypothetical protein GX335_05925 [Firmicutes bacterium]|nr:hypothetical protein [Bacillota bacterium]
MAKCPFCNQPMQMVKSDEYEDYTDFYVCGACQLEQMAFWEPDQLFPLSEDDPSQGD